MTVPAPTGSQSVIWHTRFSRCCERVLVGYNTREIGGVAVLSIGTAIHLSALLPGVAAPVLAFESHTPIREASCAS